MLGVQAHACGWEALDPWRARRGSSTRAAEGSFEDFWKLLLDSLTRKKRGKPLWIWGFAATRVICAKLRLHFS